MLQLPVSASFSPWGWLSHEPRGVVVADFNWGDMPVRAIVTHLDPFSAQLREIQAAQIVAGLVPSRGTVVLLGDMNAVPTRLTLARRWFHADRAHDVLTSGRLFDLRQELGGDDTSTWSRWATYPANAPVWPLDAIFATSDLQATGLDVMGHEQSDHLGLQARLLAVTDTHSREARFQEQRQRREGHFKRMGRCNAPTQQGAHLLDWLREATNEVVASQD